MAAGVCLTSCGGADTEKKSSAKTAEPAPTEKKPVTVAEAQECFEKGGSTINAAEFVSTSESEKSDGNLVNRYKLAMKQRGYLDVDFADIYFLNNSDEVAKQLKRPFDHKEDGIETYGSVLVEYNGATEHDSNALVDTCLGVRPDIKKTVPATVPEPEYDPYG